ncbi:MAG: hypothetical protein AWU59_1211 [Methanolobus sp. T82-4]|nr:MAG: hypothetical protein AWU59_1211 [Methanolobus sp. T82-4]
MKYTKKLLLLVATIAISLALVNPALGISYKNVDFPSGDSSFADEVVEYQLNGGASSGDINRILGIPDNYYVSLGAQGYAIIKFTDNSLTTSGDSEYDLAVFEAGSSTDELVEVFISTNDQDWIKLGNANRKTLFDIDSVNGVVQGEKYSYVKLVDYNGLNNGASYEGADMDAVGAITSTDPASGEDEEENNSNEIPEFPTIALPIAAILGLAFFFQHRKD